MHVAHVLSLNLVARYPQCSFGEPGMYHSPPQWREQTLDLGSEDRSAIARLGTPASSGKKAPATTLPATAPSSAPSLLPALGELKVRQNYYYCYHIRWHILDKSSRT